MRPTKDRHVEQLPPIAQFKPVGVPIFAVIYRYISMNTNDRLRRKNQEQSTRKYEDYSKYDIEREELKNHEKPQK